MKFLKPTIYAAIFLASLVTFNQAQAATRTWRGTTSTAWNTAGNWLENAVPTSADDVVFGAAADGDCSINAAANVNSITIQSGYTGVITQANTVTIGAGGYSQADGTFNASSSTITCAGNWTNAGTFTAGTGTIQFTGQTPTITPGAATYNNVQFTNTGNCNGLAISGTLYVAGNLYSNRDVCGGAGISGSIRLNGSTDQTITGKALINVTMTINKSGGSAILGTNGVTIGTLIINNGNTFTVSSNYSLYVGNSTTYAGTLTNNGTFNAGTGTIYFYTGSGSITPGSSTYNNAQFLYEGNCNTLTISGTFYVAGNLYSNRESWCANFTGNIRLNGAANQTITGGGSTRGFRSVTITIAKSGGSAILGTTGMSIGTLIINSANTFNCAEKNLTGTTITNNGTLQLQGLTAQTIPTPTLNSGSTVEYTATSGSQAIKNWTYTNATLKINGSGGTFTLPAALTCAEVNITAGTLDVTASNYAINVSGNWANTGSFTARSGTVTFNATSGTKTITSGGSSFYNLTFNGAGGVWQLQDALSTTGTVTLTRGTLDLNGNTLTTAKFSSTGTVARELKATGGGNIYITGTTGTVLDMTDPTSLTVSNAPAITLNGVLTAAATFAGGGKTFGNFWNHTTGAFAVQFTGSNVFNDFKVDAGRTVQFTAGTTTTVTTATLTGTSGSHITLGSITSAAHTLAKTGVGTISGDYLDISYSTATPASTWYATNSTNNGNNSGWIFGQIYRSAAPDDNGDNNIAALATGGSNAMTIAGSTATFTTALPDNIGVGDVLQYDSNNNGSIGSGDAPAFISGRTSSTVYTVKTAAGGIPTARAADTTWSIFRAYTSLFNAEAGTENTAIDSNLRNFDTWSGGKDLAASGEQWNITLYANGITADTTAVTVDGWTTSASNYIKIYTPYLTTEVGTSQRHQGKWDTGKYNLSPATGIPLTISEENVRVDGLEIYSVDNHGISVDGATGASNVYISNNVIKGNATASKYAVYLNATGAASTAKIWNNLIYDYSGTSASGLYENDADWTNYLYNNTFVGNTGGINNNAGAIIAKNNIVKGSGNTVAYVGTFTTSDYNATDGTDATEGGTHSRRSQTFSFVDATNKDFHLAPADTGAKGYGVNLSADSNLAFQNDIDMQERTGLWSIGADEPRETTIDSPSMPGGSKITINMSLNDKMTNGLVGMWSFDGADISGVNAYDRSPVGTNTGTISGAVPTIGKRGQALKFDGVDDQVTVADANNLTFSTGNTTDLPFTFTAWVKRNGVPPANGFTIISKTGPDVYTLPFEYLFIIGSNEKFAMILYDNSGTYQVSRTTDSAYSNDNGQWVFYTATYTGDGASSGLSLYRNGVSVVSTRESPLGTYTAMHNSTQLFRIGADFPTDTTYGKAFMKGSLDEVRVYNRALSATEVGDLYHLGNVNITK